MGNGEGNILDGIVIDMDIRIKHQTDGEHMQTRKTYKKLLIIDDDEDDRNLFIDAVKEVDETITCTIAKNGQHALEVLNIIDSVLPDFIFLDLQMPRYNGKKCLAEIRKNPRLAHIPVVIYTTSKNVEESKQLREMGACHFITKPRNADEIYYLVSTVLEEQWNVS